MKKLLLSLLVFSLIFACNTEEKPKNYVQLSGKITHNNSDKINIKDMENNTIKSIEIAKDGSFSDTLVVKKGRYIMTDGHEYAMLFLRPGDDIHITLDTDKFDETLRFTGKGIKESEYLLQKLLKQEKVFDNVDEFYALPKDKFTEKMQAIRKEFDAFLKEQKGLDVDFIQSDIDDTEGLFSYLNNRYDKMAKINKLTGKIAPQFTYENYKGGTTSLSDLKGKYVYIDVWATWCKPCLAEIPYLKKLEEEFGDKIHFVSISIDKKDKHEAWKKMVAEKELKGFQLFADNNWASQFVQDFGIDGIPHFIMIDPEGKVYKPNATRPSNPKTKELFASLVR